MHNFPSSSKSSTGLPILSIDSLEKTFPSADGDIHALHNINLEVRKGEFVCLLGASGCGKSTLLRVIGGFDSPSEGSAKIYGKKIDGPGPDRGVVFQDYALFPWLTVQENIAFGPKHRGLPKSEIKDISQKYMEMVGLTKFATKYPNTLSGGMKQRVAIARVLANDAEILLMDEPFAALDALTRAKLQEELLDIWERTSLTVIFVTHSVEEAVVLSDRIVVMGAGPGHIESDISITLPRPRDPSSVEFNDLRRDVSNQLRKNIIQAASVKESADV
ncbi:ABC transporter ATP-binding protein [Cohaesibacter celericrescens]|uniref:Sulfonate ABC transporter ATP-binding protein n=1 Tax=Cohaesibacter celericrescens TaxID=2067669 RepID=A0A2N5XRI6_9HYPH|nr:ABC transporter ATP-binding protein [Cohaesibacter celericrescens]PLW77132.1 sulfonate ABC transporter ATP-binding protein [Cohaesibacter celericrescens]